MKTQKEIQDRIELLNKHLTRAKEHCHTSKDVDGYCYALNAIPHEIKALRWVLNDE